MRFLSKAVAPLAAAAALWVGVAGEPQAQETTDQPVLLNPVTVTANKRDQSLDQVDGAVSVRTAEELEEAGVTKVADLEKVFPGLVIRTRGNRAYANFTVRGVSSPDFYNPAVQIYVDGVPQSSHFLTQELVDVDRVEFLRGPQGTLYGRNAFGGVINIITRRSREERADVTATGSNQLYNGGFAGTAVLAPQAWFLDLAAQGGYDRGRIDDIDRNNHDIDDGVVADGRMALRFDPANGPFDATLSLSHEHLRTHEEIYLMESLFDELEYRSSIQGPYPLLDRDATATALSWNYKLDGATLSGVSSYQYVDLDRETQGFSFPETEREFYQELRLAFDSQGPFSGVVGTMLQADRFTRDAQGFPGFTGDSNNEVNGLSSALFGEVTWHVTDRFDVTAGARLSYDRSAIDFSQADAVPPSMFSVPAFQFDASEDFIDVQPKLALGYQIDDNLRIYGLVSRGYKPGGFNHTVSQPQDAEAYDPETDLNFELGARSSFWDQRLRITTAVYYIRSHDKQIYVGPLPFQVIRNVGEATSTGVEFEVSLDATRNLSLWGGASFGRSEFGDADDPLTGIDYDGNRVPYAPDITANIHARYTIDQDVIPGDWALVAGVNVFSKTYFDEANTLSQPAFATADLAVEASFDNGLSLRLFVDNVSDEVYRTSSFSFGPGDVRSTASEGRIVGLTASMAF